jgi:two-component system sensor histidine kinase YesM
MGIVVAVLLLVSLIYFAAFTGTSDALVASQSREINKQIIFNYESYINSVIETANYVQFAASKLDISHDWAELNELYQVNADIKKDVVSIFLFDTDGKKLIGENARIPAESVSRSRWFNAARGQRDIFHFTAQRGRTVTERRDEEVIAVSKVVKYFQEGIEAEGVMLIELNWKAITDLAGKTNLGDNGHILIIDDSGDLIYASEAEKAAFPVESYALSARKFLGGFAAEIMGVEMYIHVNTLSLTRWRIVTVSNIDGIRIAQQQIIRILLIIFLGSVAVAAAVSAFISMRISRPVNQLKQMMAMVEEGDFHSNITVTGQREIVVLSESFNRMVEKLHTLMERLVSEQREKKKTELRALQNQINPHFLYNTLDSIVWLAEHQRTGDVITTVVALARFFRISISKGETFIPVADELSHVESYLTIQKIRYIDKFVYRMEIDKDILQLPIMKLILQPLVENAIYHGMGDESGSIIIIGKRRDGMLIFKVTNSGYGITEEKIKEMNNIMREDHSRNGIGIRNVFRRLKLYYGPEADVLISSVPDESTTVTVLIPENNEGGL